MNDIFIPIKNGDIETVRELLEDELNVQKLSKLNSNCLHYCCKFQSQNYNLLKLLINAGVDPTAQNKSSPLHFLLVNPKVEFKCIKLLLDSGSNPNTPNHNSDTCFHLACEKNLSLPILKYFVSKGSEMNLQNIDGDTPLHMLCKSGGSSSKINFMIENGSDLKLRNKANELALHSSLEGKCEFKIIKQLFEHSEETEESLSGINSDSLLHYCLRYQSNYQTIKYFVVKKGISINCINSLNQGLIHYLIKYNRDLKVIELLFSNGMTINFGPQFEYKLIYYSIKKGISLEFFKVLLSLMNFANINGKMIQKLILLIKKSQKFNNSNETANYEEILNVFNLKNNQKRKKDLLIEIRRSRKILQKKIINTKNRKKPKNDFPFFDKLETFLQFSNHYNSSYNSIDNFIKLTQKVNSTTSVSIKKIDVLEKCGEEYTEINKTIAQHVSNATDQEFLKLLNKKEEIKNKYIKEIKEFLSKNKDKDNIEELIQNIKKNIKKINIDCVQENALNTDNPLIIIDNNNNNNNNNNSINIEKDGLQIQNENDINIDIIKEEDEEQKIKIVNGINFKQKKIQDLFKILKKLKKQIYQIIKKINNNLTEIQKINKKKEYLQLKEKKTIIVDLFNEIDEIINNNKNKKQIDDYLKIFLDISQEYIKNLKGNQRQLVECGNLYEAQLEKLKNLSKTKDIAKNMQSNVKQFKWKIHNLEKDLINLNEDYMKGQIDGNSYEEYKRDIKLEKADLEKEKKKLEFEFQNLSKNYFPELLRVNKLETMFPMIVNQKLQLNLTSFSSFNQYGKTDDYLILKATIKENILKEIQDVPKVVLIKRFQFTENRNSKLFSNLTHLYNLNHPSVEKILSVFFQNNFIFIVTPFYSNINLLNYFQNNLFNNTNNNNDYDDNDDDNDNSNNNMGDNNNNNQVSKYAKIQTIFQQILMGLSYIHLQSIIHRNLNLSNIVLANDEHPIIINFEYSIKKSYSTSQKYKNYLKIPKSEYLAPECQNNQNYSEKSDLYSIGVMLYKCVFDASSSSSLIDYDKIKEFKNQELKDLITQLLVTDPEKRPNYKSASYHSFFTNFTENLLKNFHSNKQLIDSDHKIEIIRFILNQSMMRREKIQVLIPRSDVMNSLSEFFNFQKGQDILLKLFDTQFIGERTIDLKGVTSEMFSIFFYNCFDPKENLFETNDEETQIYLPSQKNWTGNKQKKFFAIGRSLLKCLIDQRPVHLKVPPIFYKFLLNSDNNDLFAKYTSREWMKELEMYDFELARSYYLTKDWSAACVSFKNLKGETVPLTNENKDEYLIITCRDKLIESRKLALEAIKNGFQIEVSDLYDQDNQTLKQLQTHLKIMTTTELLLLLCGNDHIDSKMILKEIEFKDWLKTDKTPSYFKRFLEDNNKNTNNLRRFLRYITATTSIPFNGFKTKIKIFKTTSDKLSSHTCFNQLDSPEFSDYDTFAIVMVDLIESLDEDKLFDI
ncbi:ankyrin repeat [Anaeramoeba flamelloides]|uniref:non-specific serine/threonine protein kinase n=1 Tax=Anaeramoeba flamelloides TaxID=1746091 RepID=A0ABQ8XPK3_9EUKA|nr:ankyrin repeat [Anaeramoeba flamelloides]